MTNKDVIGKMRHRMQFLSPLIGRDENGAELNTWIASQELWCNIEYKMAGSDEEGIGNRITAMTSAIVTLRHVESVTAKMRLFAHGAEWNIKSVLHDDKFRFLTLECVKDKPSNLLAYSTEDGQTWVDPNGNSWFFDDPSQSLLDATKINWTDSEGRINRVVE